MRKSLLGFAVAMLALAAASQTAQATGCIDSLYTCAYGPCYTCNLMGGVNTG